MAATKPTDTTARPQCLAICQAMASDIRRYGIWPGSPTISVTSTTITSLRRKGRPKAATAARYDDAISTRSMTDVTKDHWPWSGARLDGSWSR